VREDTYALCSGMPERASPRTPKGEIASVDAAFLQQAEAELAGWTDPVARLREALAKDEFALYCQPVLALRTGNYPFAEVLVRMQAEEQALLPPGEFLPVLEHYHMMPQLDRWVLQHAVAHLARGSGIARLTLNLSGQTLEDAQFPAFVAGALAAAAIAPERVMFEIDESDLLGSPRATEQFVLAAKALGCGVLLDSFGKRAVSFAPLKTLRIDFFKVDGSITRRILSSEAARNKLNAIIRVGDAIGVGVIAECVEEQDVLVGLKSLGVGYAQGFGIARPQPIDAITGD
jgi:EAL domain-containing protein (putative c-di-GMP-specific phosphodiesterase class I)